MSKGKNKAENLRKMELWYAQGRYSDIEMAKKLAVSRQTAFRYRTDLAESIELVQDEQKRWYIDRVAYISEIRVDLFEALTLYLAARRFSRQTQTVQTHLARGLEKLGQALHRPMTQRLIETASQLTKEQSDLERTKVLETVAKAWAENHTLSIMYRALDTQTVKNHKVRPYLIEPSQWSDSVYLIGYSNLNKRVVPFKLDRIEKAILSSAEIPNLPDFDEQQLLDQAWGVWTSDKQPTTVKLRFSAGAIAKRVRESIWHPSQQITMLPDGMCLWSAEIAEWREMLPWIRGWGADCEVLAPIELRETLMGEIKAMAEQYGWYVSSTDNANSSAIDDFWEN